MIRVLIADDQDLVRAGFSMILSAHDDIEVVGEASNGRDAVSKALHLRPDVCLFDVRMPELDGIAATKEIAGPHVEDPLKVIIVTTFDIDEYVYSALKAGARGFLLKDAGPTLLVEAIHAAMAGDAMISPSITARLLDNLAEAIPDKKESSTLITELSDREEEVLLAVARGLTNQELSEQLHISVSTVKSHVANLMGKLGVRNRVEVAIWAYENGRIR